MRLELASIRCQARSESCKTAGRPVPDPRRRARRGRCVHGAALARGAAADPPVSRPTTQPVAVVREGSRWARSSTSASSPPSTGRATTCPRAPIRPRAARGPDRAPAARSRRARAESALLPAGSRAGLVSLIDPTHRAVSVKVDPVVGVAGFVVPGSRVDVLVTINRIDTDDKTRQQGDPPGRRSARDRPEARGGQGGRARARAGRDARDDPEQAERLT